MPAIEVVDGDGAWPDLKGRDDVMHVPDTVLRIAILPAGMVSGKPSIAIRVDLPPDDHGRGDHALILETSAEIFLAAATAVEIKAKQGGLKRD